ncbi:DUF6603 domain-containing protein [Streptomyces celluloflavus]|uniref:DUF6603 domain-containing protein n=1 Tax=Streptomyces celluloflavus TaxID=58344 RepID=UPI0036DBA20B
MAMTVQALREKIKSSADTFAMSGEEFGTDQAEDLFRSHLANGSLDVQNLTEHNVDELAVAGSVYLRGAENACAARVTFQADARGEQVCGILIDVTLPDWTVPSGHTSVDPGVLQKLGEGGVLHLMPGVVPGPDGGPVCAVGFGVEVAFPDAGAQHKPYVWGMPPASSLLAWVLRGAFPDVPLTSLGDLTALGSWTGKQVGPFEVPQEITPGNLALTWLMVKFTPPREGASGEIVSVAPRVSLGTKWQIVEDMLEVSELYAEFEIFPGLARPQGFLGGIVSLPGGVQADVKVRLPDGAVTGIVTPKAGVTLEPLLKKYFPDSGLPELNKLGLQRILLTASPWTNPVSYSLGLYLEGGITVGPATVTDLYLEISKSGTTTGAVLGCVWKIGDGEVSLTAERVGKSWSFTGQALGMRPADLFRAFDLDVPPVLKDLTVEQLGVAFSSGEAKKIALEVHARFSLGQVDADLCLKADLVQEEKQIEGQKSTVLGWKQSYTGTLILQVPQQGAEQRTLTFTVDAVEQGEFTASWSDTKGVSLKDLADALGVVDEAVGELLGTVGTASSVTISYAMANKAVFFAARSKDGGSLVVTSLCPPGGERLWAGRVTVGLRAGLSQVPLLQGQIPDGQDVGLRGVGVLVAPKELSAKWAGELNKPLERANGTLGVDERFALLPAQGVAKGVVFAVDLKLPGAAASQSVLVKAGTGRKAAALDASPSAGTTAPAPAPAGEGAAGGRVVEGVVVDRHGALGTDGPGAAPMVAWVDIQRSIGPVQVGRAGVSFADGTVWVLFEASLGMAGLTLGVEGLGIGVPLGSPASPVFRLDGLSVGYDRPPLTILGALVNRRDPAYEVLIQGALAVSAQKFGLTALGAYARTKGGDTSMFVFGRASGRFGGPPPFQVTGIMAGFGYNTTVRVPDGDQVLDFPFLKEIGQGGDDPLVVLAALMSKDKGAWVRPAVGQIWFAAGLAGKVFEFLDCQALLVLEVGEDFAVAVLGTATARFPQSGRAYAQASLGLSARYRASEGVLKLSAQLAPGSYLIDQACVLTGGFALYVWLSGPQSGDFVLTLGGYHPGYRVPAHYPRVPQLGFSWTVSRGLTVRGGAFFALTPGAVMAGGELEVNYRSGDLHAWLTAYARMLIEWAPFRFEVGIGIDIGVSYVLDLWLVRETIRVEVGASLDLWGPPTAGTVTVKLWFIKFTVAFGSGSSTQDKAASWEEVARQLPPKEDAVRLLPTEGLMPVRATNTGGQEVWVVGPGAFSFAVRTAVPVTTLHLGEGNGSAELSGTGVNLRPRRAEGRDLISEFTLTLTDSNNTAQPLKDWQPSSGAAATSGLPAALWGPYTGKLDVHSPLRVSGQLTGADLRIPPPTPGDTPGPIPAGCLTFDDRSPDGILPLTTTVPPGPDLSRGLVAVMDTGKGAEWARGCLFDAMEYLGVSPRTNEPLRCDDLLVAGDVNATGLSLRRAPAPPGPRLYALDTQGELTAIDTDNLAVSAPVGARGTTPNVFALSADGHWMCGTGTDQYAEVWDISAHPPGEARRVDHNLTTNAAPRDIAVLPGDTPWLCITGPSQTWMIDLNSVDQEEKDLKRESFGLGNYSAGAVVAGTGVCWQEKNKFVFMTALDHDTSIPRMVARVDIFSGGKEFVLFQAGPLPSRLAMDPKGRWLYVLNDRHATVSVVDNLTGDPKTSHVTPLPTGTDPSVLVASADGSRLYVANRVPGTVSVFDTSGASATDIREVDEPVWVGSQPVALALSTDDKRLFVARADEPSLSVLDTGSGAAVLLPVWVKLPAPAVALAATCAPVVPPTSGVGPKSERRKTVKKGGGA